MSSDATPHLDQLVARAAQIFQEKEEHNWGSAANPIPGPMDPGFAVVEAYVEQIGEDSMKALDLMRELVAKFDNRLDYELANGDNFAEFVISCINLSSDCVTAMVIERIPDYESMWAERTRRLPVP